MQSSNTKSSDVAVFWDYENCHSSSQVSGYEVVNGIRNVAHRFGSVKHFKAYMEMPDPDTPRSLGLRSELQSSGVSLTDCPHNGRKNVADQMIIVDMMAYAMDHPAPATIILISGDRDFAYAVSILGLRRYKIVIVSLPMPGAHISLKSQASVCLDWNSPTARRVSYLPTPESSYSAPKVTQPSKKPMIPVAEPSTPIFVSPIEPVMEHPRPVSPAREEPEVRPAYSPNSTPIPKPFLNLASVGNSAIPTVIPGPESTNTPSQSWQVPVHSSAASFSEDLLSAHIRRCMDIVSDVRAPSPQISGPSTNPHMSTQIAAPQIPVPSATSSMQPPTPIPTPQIPGPSMNLSMPPQTPVLTLSEIPGSSTNPSTSPKTIPPMFRILVESLQKQRDKGVLRPLRSIIAVDIITKDRQLYKRAGVEKFAQFSALAEKAKIIELGGSQAQAWISLHTD
ncbi:DUF537-domain-containing protein [Mycena maculata]|uniref:DUF537-domain-containing protein n=1 Tax=Mycena maculata TaxID=230809 RepID=A0AAD7MZ56_9AGAR|nr:DUF537-domain-containing protein [Mycena maculata]